MNANTRRILAGFFYNADGTSVEHNDTEDNLRLVRDHIEELIANRDIFIDASGEAGFNLELSRHLSAAADLKHDIERERARPGWTPVQMDAAGYEQE